MPTYYTSSDSDDQPHATPHTKLFGRERPLHDILGGGRVANVLLWRDKKMSGSLLAGATVIWLLFAVAEYNFVTLVCHISITTMLVSFIWSNLAAMFERDPPNVPEMILPEQTFREFAFHFHDKLSVFLHHLYGIACGRDPKLFLLTIVSLWIIAMIGSCCETIHLLYFGFLALQTLPALYERYEDEVDYIATRGNKDARRLYRKFDRNILTKIPRGPVKDKKFK